MTDLLSEFTHGKIIPINIEHEMKKSYLLYSMSVIVGRALPDVRDGLKPIHRRILYAMHDIGLTSDKPYRKSATVVGEVMGKYHPHGDSAIYDTMVRMAQDFSSRYMLVDGHGNFGSVDGDPAAAMRYTEVRMAKIASAMLADIDKETVDFIPNFDESLKEPSVLPSRFPHLLANGSSGIAVGMATNMPPHNLTEIIDGVLAMIDNPDITISELMKLIPGPDFPTGGIIMGTQGIRDAYSTGRGSIKVRAKVTIDTMSNGKPRIIVHELPYQVNKAKLIEKIAQLVRDKIIDGITDLRDESDRAGMRIVIELRRDSNPNVVLNHLFKHTPMQSTFGVINLVLVNNEPKVLNIYDLMKHYVVHQEEVVTRRTRFDLRKAEERAHILEGFLIALDNIDEIIRIIKGSKDSETARPLLMETFNLSERQAQAILDMRLARLTGLERQKIEDEYKEVQASIARFNLILSDNQILMNVIKDELIVIRDKYGDDRRTQITETFEDVEIEDLIHKEDVIITMSHQGYIKRLPVTTYKPQKRGGRGVNGMTTKEEDFVERMIVTTTHDTLLVFTNNGKVYSLKAYEVPEAQRQARGTSIVNIVQLSAGEKVTALVPVNEFSDDVELVMGTKYGVVKKTSLTSFDSIRKGGIIGISLDDGDELIGVKLVSSDDEILMVTKMGMSIKFPHEQIRSMGRTARGVKGIDLKDGDYVVGMDIALQGQDVLVVTEDGYGKRTPVSEYRVQNRGGMGIKAMNLTPKTGLIAAVKLVREENELVITSASGHIIRMQLSGIPRLGRSTQGVKVINLENGDQVAALAQVSGTSDSNDVSDSSLGNSAEVNDTLFE